MNGNKANPEADCTTCEISATPNVREEAKRYLIRGREGPFSGSISLKKNPFQ
jgi:hypothetical protein